MSAELRTAITNKIKTACRTIRRHGHAEGHAIIISTRHAPSSRIDVTCGLCKLWEVFWFRPDFTENSVLATRVSGPRFERCPEARHPHYPAPFQPNPARVPLSETDYSFSGPVCFRAKSRKW